MAAAAPRKRSGIARQEAFFAYLEDDDWAFRARLADPTERAAMAAALIATPNFVNLKNAVCSVPSLSFTVSLRAPTCSKSHTPPNGGA